MQTSGNQSGWFTAIAHAVMDGGDNPPSIDKLYAIVPRQVGTHNNDARVTASKVGLGDDYTAGCQFIINEMVGIMREKKLVGGTDDALKWIGPTLEQFKVKVNGDDYTLRSAEQRRYLAVRHNFKFGAVGDVVIIGERGGQTRRELEVHPYANMMPQMTDEEWRQTIADIEKHGVKEPLTLFPDKDDPQENGKPRYKVLDGRHRLYIAAATNQPVRVRIHEGDEESAKQLVFSLNVIRRHLNKHQLALIAIEMFGEEAKAESAEKRREGSKLGGYAKSVAGESNNTDLLSRPAKKTGNTKTVDRIVEKAGGKTAGMSVTAVKLMEKIIDVSPSTADRVKSGELTSGPKIREAAELESGQQIRTSTLGSTDSIRRLLNHAKYDLNAASEKFDDLPVGTPTTGFDKIFDELEANIAKLRPMVQERIAKEGGEKE